MRATFKIYCLQRFNLILQRFGSLLVYYTDMSEMCGCMFHHLRRCFLCLSSFDCLL